MRILLVHPQLNQNRLVPETPSRALLILGTLAQQRGHEVKILHLDIEEGLIHNELVMSRPDIIGITCNTLQVKSARQLVKDIRLVANEYVGTYNPKIVIGGPHASAWNGDNGDKVVIGEGENRWLKLIGEKPGILSIDDVPTLNYDLVDLDRFCGIAPVGVWPSMAIMASRGCPFSCTFCNTPVFWGKQVRYRNPQYVVDEVEHLHEKYGISEVFFQDDTFNLNHQWAFRIFDGIIQRGLNKEMLFKIACRVNEKLITRDFLDLAARAGVWNIFYGVESGSQEMLDLMKKDITIAEIKRAVKMANEAGIKTQCSFIVGLPGESLKTLKETGELLNVITPTRVGWTFFCPFPNTEATKEVISKGHIREVDYDEYGYGKVMARTDALDFEELEAFGGFSSQ